MITLVLGGTRSGKSAMAEAIAGSFDEPVTYVATAIVDPTDTDHVARITEHRGRRPPSWSTVECLRPSDLAHHLRAIDGVALVDSLGTWVTQHPDLTVDAAGLLEALASRSGHAIVVSEEVGLAIHPPSELGRRYVDAVGTLNQQISEVADRVLLVVAGRAIELPAFGDGADPR